MIHDFRTRSYICELPSLDPPCNNEVKTVVDALRKVYLSTRAQAHRCRVAWCVSEETLGAAEDMEPQDAMNSMLEEIDHLYRHVNSCAKYRTDQESQCTICCTARTDAEGARVALDLIHQMMQEVTYPH
eukprot:Protomagalhaensia_wolfi_Nauph_80__1091@NODE_1638_length_1428_cov_478_971922_g1268_i0_p2_GENE_NODE_1638_length_1428_cov_478_971922_g1268_i0NODE_1638_length_1428_cov_478_971922_g1268_i0_p2_ORF_typecomplete_len129_score14_61ClpS/PF02617_17/2ClpS/PF02617_17/1_1e03ClpS/PF02617_17/1_4e02_NODE_1638_length_1428_cov_478_971922_g1268_i09071293